MRHRPACPLQFVPPDPADPHRCGARDLRADRSGAVWPAGPLRALFRPVSCGLIHGPSGALRSPKAPRLTRMWQSCTGLGTVEKARKFVLAFPTSYAKLLQGLAKTAVLSQRICNGVG